MEFDFLKEMTAMVTFRRKQQEYTEALDELTEKMEKDMEKGIFPGEKLNNLSAVIDQMTKIIKDISKE